jgi:hypothetical protein
VFPTITPADRRPLSVLKKPPPALRQTPTWKYSPVNVAPACRNRYEPVSVQVRPRRRSVNSSL